jgi:hypothetical protein
MHGYLEVKNWEQFQHYKDRNPPWIKLHAALLDDYEFARLQDASKAHLMGIWILASKHGNKVPADPEWIARRIGATSRVDLEVLIAAGFISRLRRASDPLPERQQSAMPETEAETEAEESQKQTGVSLTVVGSLPAKGRTLDAIQSRLAAVLAEVVEDGARRLNRETERRIKAELVFTYWATKLNHPKALFDPDRERRIVKQLELNNGDVHELLYVVDGALKDDWTMGRSSRSTTRYDGIETIYQDRSRVEKFAGCARGTKTGSRTRWPRSISRPRRSHEQA